MAVLINGQVGFSGGYQFGVKTLTSETVFEFPTSVQAEKIAKSIKGAKVVMRASYVTEWMDTEL